MPSYSEGIVNAILSERPGLQRVQVDGERAYVLTQLIGTVAVGDRVVMNTTAVDLDLGTGGWHVVHWNLSREAWSAPGPGHIMKLRYTSLQTDTGAAEEAEGYAENDLAGVPVVVCALHSQMAVVAAVIKHAAPGIRLAYVMTDGAALPLALSDLVHELGEREILDLTVTAGHAFGGDFEAVNVASALAVARGEGADAIVVSMGPGVVGTGTRLGTTAIEVASIADLAAALGARPVVAVRASEGDRRGRHAGISHHTRTALALARSSVVVAMPLGEELRDDRHQVEHADPGDVGALLSGLGLHVTTMGREVADDPAFFESAGAAALVAVRMLGR